LREFYDHYYDRARFELPLATAASLERLVQSFAPFRCTGRWLDIGYGEGGLLEIAEQPGWSCYGVEISPQALAYGKQRGWVVAADGEADLCFPLQGFDVITMIEFLEHVLVPAQFLQAAARWLRPGGLLYATTPNAGSLNRRLLGLEWSIFHPPEHITIWTARGLREALAQSGFQTRQIRTEGFNPCEILARWRSRGGRAVMADRNQTALSINRALAHNPWRRALKAGINRGLSALRIGDSLKVWALRSRDRAWER
jgi:SAM-dependent methyltransferase